jgi:nucleoside-diphosphate-sugar epimerase
MKKIILIGGSGFIGTRLFSRLLKNKKNKLLILDKEKSSKYPNHSIVTDVRSKKALRTNVKKNAVLINLAAEHADNVNPVTLYKDVNEIGASNICQIAKEKNVNFIIFTSSVAIYGSSNIALNEASPALPFNEYGKTKLAAEKIFTGWQNENSKSRTLVIIRPTVVFGENNRGNIYKLFSQIAKRRFLIIGNGKNIKSIAYVENVAAFIELTLGLKKPGVYIFNYADKPDFTIKKFACTVQKILFKEKKFFFHIPYFIALIISTALDFFSLVTKIHFDVSRSRVKKFCINSIIDSNKSLKIFKPSISINSALRKTLNHEFLNKNNKT